MKFIALILLFIFPFISLGQKLELKDNIRKDNYFTTKQNVKSITVDIHSPKADTTKWQKINLKLFRNYIYTDTGKIEQRIRLKDNIKLYERYYDKRSRIVKHLTYKEDGSIFLEKTQSFINNSTYPRFYELKSGKNYSGYNIIETLFQDTLVKEQHFTLDNVLRYSYFYEYDKKNRLIKEKFLNTENGTFIDVFGKKDYLPNDSILYKYSQIGDTLITKIYKRNQFNKRIKEILNKDYYWKKTEKYWHFHSLDSIKLSNTEIIYRKGDSLSQTIIYPKPKGNTIFQFNSSKNKKESISKINNTYTRHPKIITRREYTYFNYVYDERGNWIKRITFKNNDLIESVSRKIVYLGSEIKKMEK